MNDHKVDGRSVDAAGIPVVLGRRGIVAGGLLIMLAPFAPVFRANAAASDRLETAVKELTGGAAVQQGRVKLDLPALAENGFSVPITVSVESPMTAADHVQTIHILSEKNPVTDIVAFRVGPRSGHALVSTSVRLADSQKVVAVARMSDGSFWSGGAEIIVTIAACIDGG